MSHPNVRVKIVDAFTTKPFHGNPAGVVTEADGLTVEQMQKIAQELNLSETVFALKPSNDEADLRVRWFTPTQEVGLCGHATIALFHAFAEQGLFGLEVDEDQTFLIETKSGLLTVDVEWKDFLPYIKFSLPIPRFSPYPDDIKTLCGALGLSDIELSKKAKPLITDNGYCYVPVRDYDSLKTLEPDMTVLKGLHYRHDLVGFVVATTDTGDTESDWHMRFFAPALGVREDPVTGSAQGPMAIYLLENGLLDRNVSFHTFRGSQGRALGRPGTVTVHMGLKQGFVDELIIAGQAVTVLDGTIRLQSGNFS
jgi:trans-2,3-dihydro-3-hydroxyanthranilate isomerase